MSSLTEQAQNLLNLIPETGSIGNITLVNKFNAAFPSNPDDPDETDTPFDENFKLAKAELLAAGLIKLGRGKGGSVKRTNVFDQAAARVITPIHTDAHSVLIYPSSVSEQEMISEGGPSVPDSTGDSIDGPGNESF